MGSKESAEGRAFPRAIMTAHSSGKNKQSVLLLLVFYSSCIHWSNIASYVFVFWYLFFLIFGLPKFSSTLVADRGKIGVHALSSIWKSKESWVRPTVPQPLVSKKILLFFFHAIKCYFHIPPWFLIQSLIQVRDLWIVFLHHPYLIKSQIILLKWGCSYRLPFLERMILLFKFLNRAIDITQSMKWG